MSLKQIIFSASVLVVFAAFASADSLVYVVSAGITGNGTFGTVDLNTGAFQQIGPGEPDGYFGIAPGPNGSLVSLTYTGNLDSIEPATGVPIRIGPTGLGNCINPTPSCPPTSAYALGGFNGKIYATDYANSIYVVDPATGKTTLLAQNSGIPASPFVLGSSNPDGTLNLGDEAIWQSGGKLYATYDAWVASFGPNGPSVVNVDVAPELYGIDPTTGLATAIGPTALGIGAVVDVNGTDYAFDDPTKQILALDLTNGSTTAVGNFDPAAGVIQGATPTPEPSSLILVGTMLLGFGSFSRRKALSRKAKHAVTV